MENHGTLPFVLRGNRKESRLSWKLSTEETTDEVNSFFFLNVTHDCNSSLDNNWDRGIDMIADLQRVRVSSARREMELTP